MNYSDVFVDVTKHARKIPTSEYQKSGKYPIIDQGQKQIAGYTDIEEGLFTDVPAIIFGDHTRIIKYIDTPFFIGADGVKVIKCLNKGADYKYCYYLLKSARIPDTGYNRHYKWLKESVFSEHNKQQQKQIVDALTAIDQLMVKYNTEINILDELVKSRFVEMFGDVVYNSKQWEIYTFSEIATSRLGKMLDSKKQTGNYSFPYLANYNVQWFRFELDNLNKMDFNEKDQIEFALEEGDLLVCEGGEIGRCAIWHNEVSPCFFQKALHRVRCKKDIIIPDYLAWWFRFNCDNNGFSEIEGAKATIAHLPGAKLKKLNVVVPPLDLQKQFADFVTQIDKSKLAVKQILEKAETLKKSLMQEYFG